MFCGFTLLKLNRQKCKYNIMKYYFVFKSRVLKMKLYDNVDFLRKKSKNTNFFHRNATQLKPCLRKNQIEHAFFILFGNHSKRGSRLVRYYGHLDFRRHVFSPILEQCVSMLCYQYFRYFNFISSS